MTTLSIIAGVAGAIALVVGLLYWLIARRFNSVEARERHYIEAHPGVDPYLSRRAQN